MFTKSKGVCHALEQNEKKRAARELSPLPLQFRDNFNFTNQLTTQVSA
jgi:hypothetical protein